VAFSAPDILFIPLSPFSAGKLFLSRQFSPFSSVKVRKAALSPHPKEPAMENPQWRAYNALL